MFLALILAVIREIGLYIASMIVSVLGMTALWFALASAGLVDVETGMYSSILLYYAVPFAIGAGALFAVLRKRFLEQRPIKDSVSVALIVGLVVSFAMGFVAEGVTFTFAAFFLLPGFALWGALSGWIAKRRRARGLSR